MFILDAEFVAEAAHRRRPDAIHRGKYPMPGELIGRIVEDAQQGEEVFDMRGLEIFQPPVFHIGDVASGELEFEPVGVVAGSEQHGLLAQIDASLTGIEHRGGNGEQAKKLLNDAIGIARQANMKDERKALKKRLESIS